MMYHDLPSSPGITQGHLTLGLRLVDLKMSQYIMRVVSDVDSTVPCLIRVVPAFSLLSNNIQLASSLFTLQEEA